MPDLRVTHVSAEAMAVRRWHKARTACHDLTDEAAPLAAADRLRIVGHAAPPELAHWINLAAAGLPAVCALGEGDDAAAALAAAAELAGVPLVAERLRCAARLQAAAERLEARIADADVIELRGLVLDVLAALPVVDPAAEQLPLGCFAVG